jgi:Right handed beta helix region
MSVRRWLSGRYRQVLIAAAGFLSVVIVVLVSGVLAANDPGTCDTNENCVVVVADPPTTEARPAAAASSADPAAITATAPPTAPSTVALPSPTAAPANTPSDTPVPSPTLPPAPTLPTTPTPTTAPLATSDCIVASTPGMVIEDVRIVHCGGVGIDVEADNVTIRNVYLEGNITNVHFLGVSGGLIEDSTLVNPHFADDGYVQQVSLDKSSNITLRNNSMTCDRGPGSGCAQEDAIGIFQSSNVLVEGNRITGGNSGSGCGVLVDDGARRVNVLRNVIRDQENCGIGIASGTDHVVEGNDIAIYNNVGIYVWNQYGGECARVLVRDNKVTGTRPWWNGDNCSQITLDGNNFEDD